ATPARPGGWCAGRSAGCGPPGGAGPGGPARPRPGRRPGRSPPRRPARPATPAAGPPRPDSPGGPPRGPPAPSSPTGVPPWVSPDPSVSTRIPGLPLAGAGGHEGGEVELEVLDAPL